MSFDFSASGKEIVFYFFLNDIIKDRIANFLEAKKGLYLDEQLGG